MLDHPAGEFIEGFDHLFEIFIIILNRHFGRADDVGINPGDAEAAFLVGAFLITFFQYDRIDQGAGKVFEIGIDVDHFAAVYYDDPLADTYLRRCEAASVRHFQGILEILDEGGNAFFVIQINWLRLFPQHFRSVEKYGLNHFCLLFFVTFLDLESGTAAGFTAKDIPSPLERSRKLCKIIAALILSTDFLSFLSFAFIPPSIMILWARTEVNRSSSRVTGIPGNSLDRVFRKASTSAAASDGFPSIFTGYPTTKRIIVSSLA